MSELFSTETPLSERPLAARLAPQAIEEFSGQERLLAEGKMLRRLVETGRIGSAVFFGPPGTGKTGLARFIAARAEAEAAQAEEDLPENW